MKTDLFVWGRPDEGAWSTDYPGSQPGRERCRGVGRGGGRMFGSIYLCR